MTLTQNLASLGVIHWFMESLRQPSATSKRLSASLHVGGQFPTHVEIFSDAEEAQSNMPCSFARG